jgi:hypothetical protein
MSDIKQLEKMTKGACTFFYELAKQTANYKEMFPLEQLIYDMHISSRGLILLIAMNEAAEIYGLTPSAAALHYQCCIS